jgi:hypothetical protein
MTDVVQFPGAPPDRARIDDSDRRHADAFCDMEGEVCDLERMRAIVQDLIMECAAREDIHHGSIGVSHGPALLFGIGTRALVWGFFVKEIWQGAFFSSPVSLFDLKAVSSSRSAVRSSPRAQEAVKVGRRANLAAYSTLPGPHLDSFEHDGTAWCGSDDDDQRGARLRARTIAPQPCIRWIQRP